MALKRRYMHICKHSDSSYMMSLWSQQMNFLHTGYGKFLLHIKFVLIKALTQLAGRGVDNELLGRIELEEIGEVR